MNIEQIKKDVQKIIQAAIKHRVRDFNDHEAHLLIKREVEQALKRYLRTLKADD